MATSEIIEARETHLPRVSLSDSRVVHSESVSSAPVRAGFAINVLKLVSGSASAQLLTIATAPFIARLFAPDAFGMAAVFISITGVISAVVGMRYELSIVLPEKDDEAANAAAVSVCFMLLTTALTALVLYYFADSLLRWLRAPELRPYLWLAPVTVLLNGVFAALSYWSTRKKSFGRLTLAQLASAVFFVVAQIGAGLAGYSSGGTIIVATVLSILISCLVLGIPTCIGSWRLFIRSVHFDRMWAALRRYSTFPKYSTASAVLNNVGWQMPTFILSGFFSAAVVGHYAIGNKLLRVPVNLVGANIATVFFQHASESNHRGTLRDSVDTMFRHLTALCVFPSLLLGFIGKDLFVVAFGNRWAEAGIYTQILSVYVLFWFMAVPLGIALNVMEKQALELRLISVVVLARLAALVVGGWYFGSARWTLALFSIAGVIVYGHYCMVVLKYCAVSLPRVGRILGHSVVTFLPAGLIVGALKYAGVRPLLVLTASASLLVLYYANLLRTEPALREILTGIIQKLRNNGTRSECHMAPLHRSGDSGV